VPQIIEGIVSTFGSLMYKIVEVGGNIVKGLWEGIKGLAGWIWDKVSGWASDLWSGIKSFFGISSPSKEMAWIGEMLVEGLAGAH
jgi:phage-related protein